MTTPSDIHSPAFSAPLHLPEIPRWTANDLFHWVRLLWPAALVVLAGTVFFAEAIVATIVSTPHPALVYAIFGVCLIAIGAAMLALRQYLYEAKLAKHWLQLSPAMRQAELDKGLDKSVFAPVYRLLSGQAALAPETRQAAVTAELDAASYNLESRLELPNFLGGALVGLGLVGTFVGLLGTLEDLSKVFSALVNSGGGTMSPTEMFADMVGKLQAPMRGMGTAFVASLYGLLGSLIVTLMLVSARKTGSATAVQVQSVVRQLGYGAMLQDDLAAAPVAAQQREILQIMKALQATVEQTRTELEVNARMQDMAASKGAQAIEQMGAAVLSLSEGQRQVSEAVSAQLQTLRDTLLHDRGNLLQMLSATRQDSVETIKAIEACRHSFDHSARSLRALLAYMDTPPGTDAR